MDTLLVTDVKPFAAGSASAEVTLRSENGEIVTFCHPCEYTIGARVPNRLRGEFVTHALAPSLSDWTPEEQVRLSEERLERLKGLAYRGCGTVLDRKAGLVAVKGFLLELGEVPCDGPLEFECGRIDLW
jgi:hypothetical protein